MLLMKMNTIKDKTKHLIITIIKIIFQELLITIMDQIMNKIKVNNKIKIQMFNNNNKQIIKKVKNERELKLLIKTPI